ncbi:MAG TPA: porin [Kofleriaceae bacterium]|jgi:hypothetical protein
MKAPMFVFTTLVVTASSWSHSTFAQTPPPPSTEPIPLVEIYGTLFPFLESVRSTGATTAASAPVPGMTGASQVGAGAYTGLNQPGRLRMDAGTTNLGFRGGVEVVHDLSVIWQIETGVQFDNGAAGASTIGSRNTQIGLTGSWGTLFLGSWDTPYKWSTVSLVNPVRGGFLADYNSILNTPGFGIGAVTTQSGRVAGAADAAFDRRQGNAIQYWTPKIGGLSARLLYSIDEGRNATTLAAPSIKPSILGAAVTFEAGPILLRDAFEAHLDYFGMSQIGGSPGGSPNNRHSTDWGNKVMAQFLNRANGFDTRIVGVFDFLSYKNDDIVMGAINKFSRPGVYGLIDQSFGKHHLWVGGGKAFEGSCEKVGVTDCTTTKLGATDLVVGYLYRATKSLDFFAAAYRIGNDPSASYTTSPPLGAPQVTAPGIAIESVGIGLWYTFSAKVIGPPGKPVSPPPPPPPIPPPGPTNEPGPVPSPTPGATTEPPAEPPPAPQPHG